VTAFGGGKSVIIGDPRIDKSPALLTGVRPSGSTPSAGRYLVTEDVGITSNDLESVRIGTGPRLHSRGTTRIRSTTAIS